MVEIRCNILKDLGVQIFIVKFDDILDKIVTIRVLKKPLYVAHNDIS